jgi:hypothetical protein
VTIFLKKSNRFISVTKCDVCVLKFELGFSILCTWIIQLNEFWEDSLENQEHVEQKYLSLCVSKRYFVCLLCNQNIPIGNTARYAPSRLQLLQ